MSVKEITVNDCLNLQKKFEKACQNAEQGNFALLLMIDFMLTQTINEVVKQGKVEDQKEARAMFRSVLRVLGEDPTPYNEPD